MNLKIVEMNKSHWESVSEIYLEGIQTNKATFQSIIPTWESWDNSHIKSCRLVAIGDNNQILGWAALSPASSRCIYLGVAEVSIYVSNKYKNCGVGTTLLNSLVRSSEENGFWTLQSVIISENKESIALHKKCGFETLGVRKRIAKMNNSNWLDVTLMERRSEIVGID